MNGLNLVKIDAEKITGIYGSSRTRFPVRMSYLHPDAAFSFDYCNDFGNFGLVLSDMWRSAGASYRSKYPIDKPPSRAHKAPAFSAHNYGLAIDVAVTKTLKNTKLTKKELDEYMAGHGWWCHRLDHQRGSEDWHYNYLGFLYEPRTKRTSIDIENKICLMYEDEWNNLSLEDIQELLNATVPRLSLKVDGKVGPKTKKAVRTFQKLWGLQVDGKVGPITARTLWFVWAEASYSGQ